MSTREDLCHHVLTRQIYKAHRDNLTYAHKWRALTGTTGNEKQESALIFLGNLHRFAFSKYVNICIAGFSCNTQDVWPHFISKAFIIKINNPDYVKTN